MMEKHFVKQVNITTNFQLKYGQLNEGCFY